MARFIDADKYVCAFVFDEEHEEQRTETMTIEDFLDRFTEEGCPTQFEVCNGELISRQAAIDVLLQHPFEKVVNCISILEELPSVHPDKDLIHLQKEQAYMQGYEDGRKPRKGKWTGKGDSEGFGIFICDKCGKFAMMEFDYCPNCGADMRGDGIG